VIECLKANADILAVHSTLSLFSVLPLSNVMTRVVRLPKADHRFQRSKRTPLPAGIPFQSSGPKAHLKFWAIPCFTIAKQAQIALARHLLCFCVISKPLFATCLKKFEAGGILKIPPCPYRLLDDRSNDTGAAHRSRWRDL